MVAATLLAAVFAGASFGTHPALALASTTSSTAPVVHRVSLDVNGAAQQYDTNAATVGDFLRERNLTLAPGDTVAPAADVPITDGLIVTVRSASPNAQASSAPAISWIRDEKHAVKAPTIHRYDYAMAPGTTKTIARGYPGERDTIVRYTQREDGSVARWVIASRVTRAPHPRIVLLGVDENAAFAQIEAHGVARMSQFAASAMQMVATAYTADCGGCGGVTASGRPAGRGVVAVDPRVIPLGTRLFIPGYGAAIAGDTGGAIHGLRIDLGFNSLREALLFGRREVTVYRLK